MHVASINLRIDVPVDGKNQWTFRKDSMIEFILKEKFDIIGMQEAGPGMFNDLEKGLSHEYQLIYQGRDSRGEGIPLAIHRRLPILDYGTRWLTETPYVESTIPGSHFPRIVTYAKFGGDDPFYVFNTHLDYASDDICHQQAKYLMSIIRHINLDQLPYVITGDFNQYPESRTISSLSEVHQTLYDMMDTFPLTFHGFSEQNSGRPIDYIFLSDQWTIETATVHHHKKPTNYLSDHYPISVKVRKK